MRKGLRELYICVYVRVIACAPLCILLHLLLYHSFAAVVLTS